MERKKKLVGAALRDWLGLDVSVRVRVQLGSGRDIFWNSCESVFVCESGDGSGDGSNLVEKATGCTEQGVPITALAQACWSNVDPWHW